MRLEQARVASVGVEGRSLLGSGETGWIRVFSTFTCTCRSWGQVESERTRDAEKSNRTCGRLGIGGLLDFGLRLPTLPERVARLFLCHLRSAKSTQSTQ